MHLAPTAALGEQILVGSCFPTQGKVPTQSGSEVLQLENGKDLGRGHLALESVLITPRLCCWGCSVACILLLFMVIFFSMVRVPGFPSKGMIHIFLKN